MEIDEQEQRRALLALLTDESENGLGCLDKYISRSINVFEVLKLSRSEIRHSNMLCWMLNPNENHGFGDAFLSSLFGKLHKKGLLSESDALELHLANMSSFSVQTEWKHIDILLVSTESKIAIAIENKVGAHEHNSGKTTESQLKAYSNVLNDYYGDYTRIKIFLTPEGESPSEGNEDWLIITYGDVVEMLESFYESNRQNLMPEVQLLIRNYIYILKTEVAMNAELIAICNRIYKKHQKALDLIFENRYDIVSQISEEIVNNMNDKFFTINDESSKSRIKFTTPKLVEYMQMKPSDCFYEIQLNPNKDGGVASRVALIFHQSPNMPHSEEVIAKIKSMIRDKPLKPNWQWKTVWASKWETISDFDEFDAKQMMDDLTKQITKEEGRLFK